MTIAKRDLPSRRLGADMIRDGLRGGVRGLTPKTALYLLATRPDIADRHRDFEAVLVDGSAPPIMRYLAALYLGKMDTAEAIAALTRNLRIPDPLVRGRVILSLAGIGDVDALQRIAEVAATLSGPAAADAAWAMRLLAHRHGVSGYEVRMPAAEEYADPRDGAVRSLEVRPSTHHELSALRESIAVEPFGMSIAWDHVYHLQCGARAMLLVPSSAVAGHGASAAPRSCTLSAIVGHWHGHHDVVPRYFLLTCPGSAPDLTNLSLWTANGRLAFAGAATTSQREARFAVKCLARIGGMALDVGGTFAQGRIEFSRKRVGIGVLQRRPAAPSVSSTRGER